MGLGRRGEMELTCPICDEGKIRVFHKEGYIQARTSRISAGAKTKFYKQPDYYEVLEDCPNCGRSKKEIEKTFKTGKFKEISHKERLKRIQEAGLPTVIESKV